MIYMDTTTEMQMKKFKAGVGFKVDTPFSANGAYKWEFEDVKLDAISKEHAEKRLTSAYGLDIIISYVKEI